MYQLSYFWLPMINYTKPFLSISEQITQISARGLLISDENKAAYYLSQIGYYRLSGYWQPLQKSSIISDKNGKLGRIIHNKFRDGAKFSQVIALYAFDKRLRLIMLDILERIEIAVRADIVLQLGQYNPWAYRDSSLFDEKFATEIPKGRKMTRLKTCLTKFDQYAKDSREDFFVHFRTTYSDPLPI